MGGGGGWGVQGEFFHTFEQKSSHYVFIEVHNQLQFTCQADIVTDSNLTPSIALLVHPTLHSGLS